MNIRKFASLHPILKLGTIQVWTWWNTESQRRKISAAFGSRAAEKHSFEKQRAREERREKEGRAAGAQDALFY